MVPIPCRSTQTENHRLLVIYIKRLGSAQKAKREGGTVFNSGPRRGPQ